MGPGRPASEVMPDPPGPLPGAGHGPSPGVTVSRAGPRTGDRAPAPRPFRSSVAARSARNERV
eukprot:655456-Hanusia_phi.AAC.1